MYHIKSSINAMNQFIVSTSLKNIFHMYGGFCVEFDFHQGKLLYSLLAVICAVQRTQDLQHHPGQSNPFDRYSIT